MIAVVNKELYRYEIHSLLKAFYPKETVKVFIGEPDIRKYPEPAFLRAQFGEDHIEMTLDPAGAPDAALKSGITLSRQAPEGILFNEKSPALKTAAKHLLYELLSEFTGEKLPWGELIGIRPTKIAMSVESPTIRRAATAAPAAICTTALSALGIRRSRSICSR